MPSHMTPIAWTCKDNCSELTRPEGLVLSGYIILSGPTTGISFGRETTERSSEDRAGMSYRLSDWR